MSNAIATVLPVVVGASTLWVMSAGIPALVESRIHNDVVPTSHRINAALSFSLSRPKALLLSIVLSLMVASVLLALQMERAVSTVTDAVFLGALFSVVPVGGVLSVGLRSRVRELSTLRPVLLMAGIVLCSVATLMVRRALGSG